MSFQQQFGIESTNNKTNNKTNKYMNCVSSCCQASFSRLYHESCLAIIVKNSSFHVNVKK